MKPNTQSAQPPFILFRRRTTPAAIARQLTSVQLARSQHNHPEARLGVPLRNQVRYVQRHGPVEEDGQQLEADDAQVGAAPAPVRARVHHPQLRKRVAGGARLRAVHARRAVPEVVERRRHEPRRRGRPGLDVREEAVVQEAALEDEVAQRVRQVPDEEEAQRRRRGRGEGPARDGVGDDDDAGRCGERHERRGVEQVGGQRGGGGGGGRAHFGLGVFTRLTGVFCILYAGRV